MGRSKDTKGNAKIVSFPVLHELLEAMYRHGCCPVPMDDDEPGWWAYCPVGDEMHGMCRLWADIEDGPPVECLTHSMVEILRALREPPKPHVIEWSDFVADDGISVEAGEIERRRRGLTAPTPEDAVVGAIAVALAEGIVARTRPGPAFG